ncbi:EAL domain-containing protein [Vibrio proteolyticus]
MEKLVSNTGSVDKYQLHSKDSFIASAEAQIKDMKYRCLNLVVAFKFSADASDVETFESRALSLKCVRLFAKVQSNLYLASLCEPSFSGQNQFRQMCQVIKNFFDELMAYSPKAHQAAKKCCIGISALGHDSDTVASAVVHAIQATMSNTGDDGTQHLCFFSTTLQAQLKRERVLENYLQQVIRNSALRVTYQPIINARTWQIAGYEALCRFPSTEQLKADTREMIGIAEELDLVSEIDLMVYQKSFTDFVSQLREEGNFINVNLSPNTSENIGLLFDFVEFLATSVDLDMSQIVIDVNELKPNSKPFEFREVLPRLKDKGTRVALDDMGMGFDIAYYLESGCFDLLRISRSFFRNFSESGTHHQVVKLLIQLCHKYHIEVIAEGVETLEEAQLLAYLGVDYMQGYVFSHPLEMDELKRSLAEVHERIKLVTHCNYDEPACGDASGGADVMALAEKNLPHMDPGEPISLAYEYQRSLEAEVLPVINRGECVGLIDRPTLNLHLTPAMGTKLETSKEAAIWNKPVAGVMNVHFPRVEKSMPMSELIELVRSNRLSLPVVVVEEGRYKGVITQRQMIQQLTNMCGPN